MMRPGRGDMMQIRSDSRIASSMSWVTNRTVVAELLPDIEQKLLHRQPRLRIERAERLVHQ